jgi:uncharacterized phage-associated protein
MQDFKIDKAKAKAALLYIATNIPNIDTHKLYKILYFAEQTHLVKYGRPITGDAFIKMDYGPVPSYVKDKVENRIDEDGSVVKQGIHITVNEYPDMEELSESDVECLDISIIENKDKTFSQLTKESHKEAWQKASYAGRIDSVDIAVEGNADKGIIDYINRFLENNSAIY